MLELSDAELQRITHKVRPSAQVRALRHMGIDHRVRPDGSVLVLRNSLHGGRPNDKVEPEFKIRWGNG